MEALQDRLQTPQWEESLCWRCDLVILLWPGLQVSHPTVLHCESVERDAA